MKKFIFFSSSNYGIMLLKTLTKHFKLELIVSQPPKPAGRKGELTPTPIGQYALKENLPLSTPSKLTSEFIQTLPQAEFAFLFAYGKIIPKQLIDFFPYGIINLHPSLLPQYRGPAPIRQALIDCQKTTGYSLMLLEEKLDSGPLIYQEKITISPEDNWQSLTEKIIKTSQKKLTKIISLYLDNKLQPRPQPTIDISYSQKIRSEQGYIKTNLPPQKANCLIRAMSPKPGAYIYTIINQKKKRLKIFQAKVVSDKLLPLLVQLEGKKSVSWKQFLEGYPQATFSYPKLLSK